MTKSLVFRILLCKQKLIENTSCHKYGFTKSHCQSIYVVRVIFLVFFHLLEYDFILFIAAGAFHISKVQDLIPELQGRFPIKVELNNLTENDFVLILTQPDNAILKQYKELLKVDGVELEFTDDAIREIARIATMENENSENLGARRLHAVMEALLEEVSYNAGGSEEEVRVTVDKDYVDEHLAGSLKTMNLRRYII